MKRVANEKLKTKTQVVLRIPILAVLLIMATGQLAAADAPRLVLQITVDGLRGDRLDLYSENFAKGGLDYLRNKGVVYHNAHYLHANTETIVGTLPWPQGQHRQYTA